LVIDEPGRPLQKYMFVIVLEEYPIDGSDYCT